MRILSKFANCPAACGILPTGLLEVPDIGWSYGCDDDDACVVVVAVVGCSGKELSWLLMWLVLRGGWAFVCLAPDFGDALWYLVATRIREKRFHVS
jgi:hypothetical protein